MKATRAALCALISVVAVLMACKSSAGSGPSPEDQQALAKFGPCATMTISSPSGAFDKTRMSECRVCCDQKSAGYASYYYHFENNQPPGRCRCVGGASAGPGCTQAKDLATCLTCCTTQKRGASYDTAKGCTCQ